MSSITTRFHGIDLEFDVEYDYTPGERGDLECPPSEGEVELTRVLFNGKDVTGKISDELSEALEQECEESRTDD